MQSGGRFGSFLGMRKLSIVYFILFYLRILGGLGFVLPGFLAMLLWSYLYVDYGLTDPHVQKSFRGIYITGVCLCSLIIIELYHSNSERGRGDDLPSNMQAC